MSKKDQKQTISKDKTAPAKKSTLLPYILVFCIPVFLYLHTLSFKFTAFDDDHLIIDNLTFLSDFSNAPQVFLKEAFVDKSGHFYRPMQTLSYMIDIKLSGGNNAWMYHLVNVLLLGFIACLLYKLLLKFSVSKRLALLSTMVYCAHPLFVSAVSWIPARGDLMLMFFALLSFLSFIEYLQNKHVKYLLVHWLSFSLALFCKETAAFLPFVFIIYYFMFNYEKRIERARLFLVVLYVVSGSFWFWLRSKAIGNYSNPNDLVGMEAFIQSVQVIPESVVSFFIPLGITEFPVFSLLKTVVGLLLIVGIIILYTKNKEKTKREMLFGFAWFILLLLPSLFFKNTQIDYLNHRFFLPMIGLLLFVLFILPVKWFTNNEIKSPWIIVAVLVVFSGISYSKSRPYENSVKFYASATSATSTSSIAYYNMGNIIKSNNGNSQLVINYYTKAIEVKPDYAEAYHNRGNTYYQQKSFDKAIADHNKAIKLKPDFADAYYDRGSAYNGQGMFDKAINDFTKTIQLVPDYVKAYNNRGFAYFNKAMYDKAISDYSRAIELKPDYVRAYNNRANAYAKQGLNDRAELDLQKAKEFHSQ